MGGSSWRWPRACWWLWPSLGCGPAQLPALRRSQTSGKSPPAPFSAAHSRSHCCVCLFPCRWAPAMALSWALQPQPSQALPWPSLQGAPSPGVHLGWFSLSKLVPQAPSRRFLPVCIIKLCLKCGSGQRRAREQLENQHLQGFLVFFSISLLSVAAPVESAPFRRFLLPKSSVALGADPLLAWRGQRRALGSQGTRSQRGFGSLSRAPLSVREGIICVSIPFSQRNTGLRALSFPS